MIDSDRMPIAELYRGVGIHAWQPAERIAAVRLAIDHVYGLTDLAEMVRYALDAIHPPEARLFAKARCAAAWQLASESRINRPAGIDLTYLDAACAGLDARCWVDPKHYGTMLERGRAKVRRDHPLTDAEIGR